MLGETLPKVMSMKNSTRELLDAFEGWHIRYRVVTGGHYHIVKPLAIQNLKAKLLNECT